jgi:mono/diheme cytochrome c family protein
MNVTSNTTRIVEYVVGIIATALIGAGIFLYSLQEPTRIVYAQQDQLETDLYEGMTLYAQNCSVCHGLAGDGIGSIPGLDNEALRQTDYDSLAKIIARGLYNTAMPAWANEDGGPLNEYQIGTLVMLIQSGDWQATQDLVVNLGLAPLVPFSTEPDLEVLKALEIVEGGDILIKGITLYAQECVACHGADGLGTTLAPVLNDEGVQSQPSETLERTINSGVAGTLMASWDSSLTDEEVDALVYLLKNWNQVPTGAIPAPDSPVPVTEESLALGASLYSSSCSNCHGPEGQGTQRAPALNVKGFLTDTVDAAIQQIITLGVPSTAMPAWGDRMTDAEIQAIVGFIRAWEPTAPEVAEPARGGGPWWKSEGTQTPGGSKGGPPWMRNESGQVNNSASLPSGGDSVAHANSGQSPSEPVQAQSMQKPQAGTSHVDSGTMVGQQQSQGVDHGNTAGGPPWANQSVELEWWQEITWQTITLSGSVFSLALFLIVVAIKRLLSLPV